MDWHPVISVQQQKPDNDFCHISAFQMYVFHFGHFFANRKNSGLTPGQNDDPVPRTCKMTQMTHWPGDPMTQFHVWCQHNVHVTVAMNRRACRCRYMLEVLPLTDWSQTAVRPALNLILRRFERMFSKIYKKSTLRVCIHTLLTRAVCLHSRSGGHNITYSFIR